MKGVMLKSAGILDPPAPVPAPGSPWNVPSRPTQKSPASASYAIWITSPAEKDVPPYAPWSTPKVFIVSSQYCISEPPALFDGWFARPALDGQIPVCCSLPLPLTHVTSQYHLPEGIAWVPKADRWVAVAWEARRLPSLIVYELLELRGFIVQKFPAPLSASSVGLSSIWSAAAKLVSV